VVIRFDAVDDHSNPVFTEYIGGLMRGVQFTGEPRGGADIPEIQPYPRIDELKWMNKIYIDPLLPFIYDGCTNIVFPIHTSKKFARSVGLPGIILQGTATLALAVREITNAFADANPASIKTIACRFTGMVHPGSRIRIKAGDLDKKNTGTRICFLVENEDGRNAVSDGFVHIKNR
jgi:hydroxyacyl-ACP dehydratase HTD2-like protein with hotdog domain